MRLIRRLFCRQRAGHDHHGCQKLRDMASDYVDDQLSSEQRSQANTHLGICPPCRAFVETLKRTVRALGSLGQEKAPDTLKQRLKKIDS
ncbi:MAG: zf-HC2 domain-containing protein [Chloroflexi bacterium]|nr:zf-HC2 domain-containing protein [Chloroflexota bacterium]